MLPKYGFYMYSIKLEEDEINEIMHPSMVKQVKHHDTVKKTNAVFKWGVKSGKEMEKLCQDMSYIHEWNIADEMTDMGILYRLIWKIPFLYHRWKNCRVEIT